MSKAPVVKLRETPFTDTINMRLNEIEYQFNPKNGTWIMNMLNMPSNNNNLINIPKRKSDIGLGPLLDSGRENNSLNKYSKEIEEMNFKIKEKKNDIEDINKKIENSKDEYVKLSEKYILESQETKKVKEAREKLDKLKKELEKHKKN